MKNLFFSLFAIGVAAVAAMTATTAMLNSPYRIGLAAVPTEAEAPANAPQAIAQASSLAQESKPEAAGPPKAGEAGADGKAAGGATSAGAGAAKDAAAEDEEGDKDPYEGIAEEELPPDLQYSADSSVSFPTNI